MLSSFDLLSVSQAIGTLKTDCLLLLQIQDMLHYIRVDHKKIVSMWIPGQAGILGMSLVIELLKKLLTKKQTNKNTDDFMPI